MNYSKFSVRIKRCIVTSVRKLSGEPFGFNRSKVRSRDLPSGNTSHCLRSVRQWLLPFTSTERVRVRVVLGCQLLLSNTTSMYFFYDVTEDRKRVVVKRTPGTSQENVMCSLITRPLQNPIVFTVHQDYFHSAVYCFPFQYLKNM